MNILSTISKIIFPILLLVWGCTTTIPEECDEQVYDGSYLKIDEIQFCPASMTYERIQQTNQGYIEEQVVCGFTTDNGVSCKNDRFINALIVIRTPYPNPNNIKLPEYFTGTYAELKELGIIIDITLTEKSEKPIFYEIDIDTLDDELFIELGIYYSQTLLNCKISGNFLLGSDTEATPWESVFTYQ